VDLILGAATEHQGSAVFRDDVLIMAVHILKESDPGTRPFNRFCTDRNSVLTIMTRHVDIDHTLNQIITFVTRKGVFPAEDISELKTALFEVLTNAIEHGNLGLTQFKNNDEIYDTPEYWEVFRERLNSREYGDKALRIECSFEPLMLQISIEDEGEGFDFENLPDPTSGENLFRFNGGGYTSQKCSSTRSFLIQRAIRSTLCGPYRCTGHSA
jgi:hypothetical protein